MASVLGIRGVTALNARVEPDERSPESVAPARSRANLRGVVPFLQCDNCYGLEQFDCSPLGVCFHLYRVPMPAQSRINARRELLMPTGQR